MGKHMSIREFRAVLSEIEQHLNEHGEIILTRHGKEVARIGGPLAVPSPKVHDLAERHAKLRDSCPKDVDWQAILRDSRGRY